MIFSALDQILECAQGQIHVDFGCKRLRDFGVCRLNTKPYTNHIHSIILSFNIISDSGLQFMSEGKWQNLQTLQLSNNEFGNKGVKYLTRNAFPSLIEIDLSGNTIDQYGFLHFSKNPWKKLQSLQFRACKSSTDTFKHLIKTNSTLLSELTISNPYQYLKSSSLHSQQRQPARSSQTTVTLSFTQAQQTSIVLRVLKGSLNVQFS